MAALLGAPGTPRCLLFLWPQDTFLQEYEDVFTIIAECANAAILVADAARQRAKVAAWKDMVDKIAHLTSTPLLLAECGLRRLAADLRKNPVPSDANIENAMGNLKEARRALDRAFVMDMANETAAATPFDLRCALKDALLSAGFPCSHTGQRQVAINANYFRVWFALRDLAVCIGLLGGQRNKSTCNVIYTGRDFSIRFGVPVRVNADFNADLLFSPQHHVESRERPAKGFPLSLSLFMAREIIQSELPDGRLEATLSPDRRQLTLTCSCGMRSKGDNS